MMNRSQFRDKMRICNQDAVVELRNGQFDFSLRFEQSVLSLIPFAGFLILIVAKIWRIRAKKIKTVRQGYKCHKTVGYSFLICLEVTLLVLWIQHKPRSVTSISASTLALVVTFLLMILSLLTHSRQIRPSSTITICLFSTLIFDIPQLRTLWLDKISLPISSCFSTKAIVKVALLVLELVEKRSILAEIYITLPPDAVSSMFNRVIGWWISLVLTLGYGHILALTQLPSVTPELLSNSTVERFNRHWKSEQHRVASSKTLTIDASQPDRYYRLFSVLVKTLWSDLSLLCAARLLRTGFLLSQPFLTHKTISVLDQASQSENVARDGLIPAALLIYIGLAVSNSLSRYYSNRAVTILRSTLVAKIYDETIDTYAMDVRERKSALTLMSTDVERICSSIKLLEGVISSPLEIVLATFLLKQQTGIICLVPFVIAFCGTTFSLFIARLSRSRQKDWIEAVQRRVTFTASYLERAITVQMQGMTAAICEKIHYLRVHELRQSKSYRHLVTIRNIVANVPVLFSPALTVILLSSSPRRDSLKLSTIFTVLSLITLITVPVQNLVHNVPQIYGSLACFARIQNFLLASTSAQGPPSHTNTTQELKPNNCIELRQIGSDQIEHCRSGASVQSMDQIRIDLSRHKSKQSIQDNVHVLEFENLFVQRQSVLVIMGPVGCGKTTLLLEIMASLAEKGMSRGGRRPKFGLCNQDPWLSNTTVRDHIIGPEPYESAWYDIVLHSCDLNNDISILPDGDRTFIGSNGHRLSGGQKQRLCLARALYAKVSVLVLDDVFSGLDSKTFRRIADRILKADGLARKLDLITILTSSRPLPAIYADQMIIFDNNGKVRRVDCKASSHNREESAGTISNFLVSQTPSVSTADVPSQNPSQLDPGSVTTIPELDTKRKLGDVSLYHYYYRSMPWRFALILLLSQALSTTQQSFSTIWVEQFATDRIGGSNHHLKNGLVYLLLAFGYTITGGLVIWCMLCQIVPKSSVRLHDRVLKTVTSASLEFFASTDIGTTLNRFSSDMSLIDMELPGGVLSTLSGLFSSIAGLVLIALGSTYMALTMPPILFILYAIQKFYLRTSRQLRFMTLESQSSVYSHFQDSENGSSTIRAFGWERHYCHRLRDHLNLAQRPFFLLLEIQRWLQFVLDMLVACIAVVVLSLALKIVSSSSAGSIGVALISILALSTSLAELITYWTQLETSLGAVARVKQFTSTKGSAHQLERNVNGRQPWLEDRTIIFDHVQACYQGYQDKPVIHDISFSLGAGQKLGICGRTGSGKSSILLALLRMLNVTQGSISLNGIDLCDLDPDHVRTHITTISQESVIFPDTLRYNLDPSTTRSDSELEQALKRVNLWSRFAGRAGLDTYLSLQILSPGEQQLLALARALLERPNILLLDESTAKIDRDTESLITGTIEQEFHGCTMIVVAHRLETILNCDRIIVLQSGRIAESGSPMELLRCEHSLFHRMYSASSSSA